MAFAPNGRARLLLFPPEGGLLTTRQASLDAADRLVAPPEGLLTLGFDPTRFQTEPPACYRASWQLPGRDSHPLATTSLCQITIYIIALQLWAHPGEVANDSSTRIWRISGLRAPTRLRPASVIPRVSRQSTSERSEASATVAERSLGAGDRDDRGVANAIASSALSG